MTHDSTSTKLITAHSPRATWRAGARANGQTNVVARVYPKAGHGVGCRAPNLPIPAELEIGPNTFQAGGGTPPANASGAETSWPTFLTFLATLPRR